MASTRVELHALTPLWAGARRPSGEGMGQAALVGAKDPADLQIVGGELGYGDIAVLVPCSRLGDASTSAEPSTSAAAAVRRAAARQLACANLATQEYSGPDYGGCAQHPRSTPHTSLVGIAPAHRHLSGDNGVLVLSVALPALPPLGSGTAALYCLCTQRPKLGTGWTAHSNATVAALTPPLLHPPSSPPQAEEGCTGSACLVADALRFVLIACGLVCILLMLADRVARHRRGATAGGLSSRLEEMLPEDTREEVRISFPIWRRAVMMSTRVDTTHHIATTILPMAGAARGDGTRARACGQGHSPRSPGQLGRLARRQRRGEHPRRQGRGRRARQEGLGRPRATRASAGEQRGAAREGEQGTREEMAVEERARPSAAGSLAGSAAGRAEDEAKYEAKDAALAREFRRAAGGASS